MSRSASERTRRNNQELDAPFDRLFSLLSEQKEMSSQIQQQLTKQKETSFQMQQQVESLAVMTEKTSDDLKGLREEVH